MAAKSGFWDRIDSLATAKATAMQGFWAAIFVASITVVMVMISLTMGGLPEGMPQIDAWAFWDAGIFVAIAWGIHRMSRVAAVMGLVLYIVSQVVMRATTPEASASGLWFAALFVLAFVNGVRGTFAYHAIRQRQLQSTSSEEV